MEAGQGRVLGMGGSALYTQPLTEHRKSCRPPGRCHPVWERKLAWGAHGGRGTPLLSSTPIQLFRIFKHNPVLRNTRIRSRAGVPNGDVTRLEYACAPNFFISQRLIMLLAKQVTEDMEMKRKESVTIMIGMSKAVG